MQALDLIRIRRYMVEGRYDAKLDSDLRELWVFTLGMAIIALRGQSACPEVDYRWLVTTLAAKGVY